MLRRPSGSLPLHASAIATSAALEASTSIDRLLAHAADQFIVAGPTVVAGYPWFGDGCAKHLHLVRGPFRCTGRASRRRCTVAPRASTVSEGMLANTADVGGQPEFNTADATMWFLHALARHIETTDDLDSAI